MTMRRRMSWAIATSAATALLLAPAAGIASAAPAPAAQKTLDTSVSTALSQDLQEFAAASGGTVSISNVSITVSPELVKAAGSSNPDAIADYIMTETKRAQSQKPAPSSDALVTTQALPGPSIPIPHYVAKKETPLPSVGIAWVNQDMSLTITGPSITQLKLKGNSYGTGLSFFAYSHINTEVSYGAGKRCVNTRMRGTFSGVVKGSPLSFAATVLATDAPRNGKMVGINYQDCK